MEEELGVQSSHTVGKSHSVRSNEYFSRIEAVNFALAHDDGQSTKDLANADVILVGVSRCGKTPTCLYMALQFGIRAANYPLIRRTSTPGPCRQRSAPFAASCSA